MGPPLGLFLNTVKTIAWQPHVQHRDPNLQFNLTDYAKVSLEPGVKLLGGAVSKDLSFLSRIANLRSNKVISILDVIATIPDPQIQLLLIRYCGGVSRMQFCFRVLPPAACQEAAALLSSVIFKNLCKIITGHPTHTLFGDFQRQLISMPLSLGGFGIYSPVDVILFAYLSAQAHSMDLQSKLFPSLRHGHREFLHSLQPLVDIYNEHIDGSQPMSVFLLRDHKQSELAKKVFLRKYGALLTHPYITSSAPLRKYAKIIMASSITQQELRQFFFSTQIYKPRVAIDLNLADPESNLFTSLAADFHLAIPSTGFQQRFNPIEARLLYRFLLLMPILDHTTDLVCCVCMSSEADVYGYHAITSCDLNVNQGLFLMRHNLLRDALADCVNHSGQFAQKDAKIRCLGFKAGSTQLLRPADLLVNGADIIDCTITSPLKTQTHGVGFEVCHAANAKTDKHFQPCADERYQFFPFSMDVCGLIHHTAYRFLSSQAHVSHHVNIRSYGHTLSIYRRRLSSAIRLGVARQLDHYTTALHS